MQSETTFTLTLAADLRDRFVAEAEAAHRPAAQVVRDFMEAYVQRASEAREHDAWFRSAVEEALRLADDPTAERIPQDEMWANWQDQRADLLRRFGGPA